MTVLLFQKDSYLQQFETKIAEINNERDAIILYQTAFFPGGGGQLYDTGEIIFRTGESYPVIKCKKDGENVIHFLDRKLPEYYSPQEPIKGIIDWHRRYQLMRTHTAMHILCGVVFRDYGALVTGGDMEPLKGRMDFEFESLSKELVQIIEDSVNQEVIAERDIKVNIHSREEAFKIPDLIRTKINLLPPSIAFIRTVEITGLDLQADGGTHVNNTREVGKVFISDYKSKGKINKRIYLELSDLA